MNDVPMERIIGASPCLVQQYLPKEETLVSGMFDPEWRGVAKEDGLDYDSNAFRVIQPTRPQMDSALKRLLENEPLSFHPSVWDVICEVYPCLKATEPVIRLSTEPTSKLDPDVLRRALWIYKSHMMQYYGPQLGLQHSEINLTTSAGPKGKAMGYKKKSEYLRDHYDWCTSWCDREDDPMIFDISGKTELIKEKKWRTGRIRPFEPQDLESLLECINQFGGGNSRMAYEGSRPRCPISVGHVQQHAGFRNLMDVLGTCLRVFSGDADGWDTRYQQLFWQLEFGWRLECAIDYDYITLTGRSGKDVLTRLYQRIFNGFSKPLLWYAPGGFLVVVYIMPSGCALTTYANSSGHFFIQAYHWVDASLQTGRDIDDLREDDFLKEVIVNLYGDDNLGGVWNHALIPFYTYEARSKTYQLFGQRLKFEDDMYSETPIGHKWLGFTCGPDHVPLFDELKAKCSMEWPTGGLTPEDRYMKAISIMLNVTFSSPKVVQSLGKYIRVLQSKYALAFPRATKLSKTLVPSMHDLKSFWLATESGHGEDSWWLEVFETLMKDNFEDDEQEEGCQEGWEDRPESREGGGQGHQGRGQVCS